MQLFVGGVEIVVREAEPHHHRWNSQVAIEGADDRNRAARTDINSLPGEYLLHGIGRGRDETIFRIHQRWSGAMDRFELGCYTLRACRADGGLQLGGGFVGLLIGDQAGTDLGYGARGDYGL